MSHEKELLLSVPILRYRLTALARSMRTSDIPDNANLSLPQSEKDDYTLFENKLLRRKRIVLLGPSCSTATCTMCPLPNENLDVKLRPITEIDMINQFESAFKRESIDNYQMITIYNNGNFFADREVSPKVRQYIYERLQKSKTSFVVVESLPQFISAEKIAETKRYLGDKQLAVAIGLQSSNDLVRELAINTTCTKTSFEKAVAILKKNGYKPLVFLMIKPPFLTEREAIDDTVESIRYLSSLDIDNPILCATRVAPNTVANLMYHLGQFKPPWLWSVIEVLKRSSRINPNSTPRVVISELQAEKNLDSICAKNCQKCNPNLVRVIEKFNITRDIKLFEGLSCDCYEDYQKLVDVENRSMGIIPLPQRVANFLQKIN